MTFRSFGEQLRSIWEHRSSGVHDARLIRAPLGAGEVDPSGGGFLVQPNFQATLVESLFKEAVLLPRTDIRETSSGSVADVRLPAVDETSRADGSRQGGALGYWVAEAASVTPTFPRFRQLNFSAKKLIAVAYVSNELLDDSAMLEASMRAAFAAEFSFAIDKAIFSGSGAGQPLGIMNAPCKISIAKETGQAAKTIVYENIVKMHARMPGPLRSRACWLINQDVEPQLYALSQAIGTAGVPVYLPANSASAPYGTLFGCPVIPIEQASTLGTEGDIVLADLGSYITVRAPLQTAISMDFAFTSDQTLVRFAMRIDGQPAWASSITPYAGANPLSPGISLASRA
jgi:HK97 family phage major capsid protein